jgi:mRNA interferase MazF
MKRGDIVTVSLPGDYGKPRPALVIQSDLFDEHSSVTVFDNQSSGRRAVVACRYRSRERA